jgi:SAM-dependent methyltransferase
MGEIFRRETAKHPEPFTGERLTAAIGGQVQIEHYHRYLFARSLVIGLDVLDVASGEGYGSALLAQVARRVLGVEHSGPAAGGAARNFPHPNLHFLQADARALPLGDASFDAVVSFETIEHFDRQDDFVREVRRVLGPDGRFIVSTPDRDIYSPAGSPANPFHVRELSRSEFEALLRDTFRHVSIINQRPMIGSAMVADTGPSARELVFDRRGDTHFEACTGLPRSPYLVAVASDRALPPIPTCLYIDRSDLDTESLHSLALADQLRQARADLAQATECAAQARQIAAHATQRAEQASRDAAQARREAEQEGRLRTEHEERIEALQRRYNLMQGSARTFIRGYLPLLRRSLFGQRP